MKSWTTWFEIPATDLHRAKKFYDTIFEMEIELVDFGPLKMGIFPHKDVGAAICQNDAGGYQPSETHGPLVYLNANPDLQQVLNRVEAAGGRIIRPKSPISDEFGFMALIVDTEGNRLGLHSDN
ncbi:MAG: VOC family protein [Saprospiraceae bacterium]|nr:VOC family protein [Lewinellaceae bacterium]